MTARLQASDEQRRRLLADVTHELRTPLSVIRGSLEGIADGVYEADEERVAAVLEQTRLMGRLLDDLQTLSTAEAGALCLTLEPTDLEALVEEVASAFAPRAAAGGVGLSTSCDSRFPPAGCRGFERLLTRESAEPTVTTLSTTTERPPRNGSWFRRAPQSWGNVPQHSRNITLASGSAQRPPDTPDVPVVMPSVTQKRAHLRALF
jgi:signal transduction histidine kinase